MIVPPDERVRLDEFILTQRDSLYEPAVENIPLFDRAVAIVLNTETILLTNNTVNIPRPEDF